MQKQEAAGSSSNQKNAAAPRNIDGSNAKIVDDKLFYDISTAENGYILVEPKTGGYACIVTYENIEIPYLNLPQKDNVIPLSMGSGEYTVMFAKHRYEKNYEFLREEKLHLDEGNADRIFLMSDYMVNYADAEEVSNTAKCLTSGEDIHDSIENIYCWVRDEIKYDQERMEAIRHKDYGISRNVPNLERIMQEKRGICLDKASLLAAMTRSCRIPSKLVIGEYEGEYHAWVMVKEKTKWLVADPTLNHLGSSKGYRAKLFY